MASTIQEVNLRLVISRLRPGLEYHYRVGRDTGYTLSEAIGDIRTPDGDLPTEQECIDEQNVYDSEVIDTATARANLKAIAQGTVGVTYTDLTVDQLKALLAVLILESGGLADDLTIRPLNLWVR